MHFSADWREGAPNVAPEERATVADFRIWIEQQNVTQHLRGTATRDHVTIALSGLAEGLAHDWWTVFGGRDREFSLFAYRTGYLVPDVRFRFDGAVFEIAAHQQVYRDPDVRFWSGPGEVLSRAEAESGLGGLVQDVVDRLSLRGVRDSSLALRWARVTASRADLDEAVFCECAGALGLDPYEISDDAVALIDRAAATFEGEALSEFLAGVKQERSENLLRWIAEVERRNPVETRLGDLRAAAADAACRSPDRELEQSWSLGYRRARAFRQVLGLAQRDRIGSFSELAGRLGAAASFSVARRIDGIRALRIDHEDSVHIHLRDHGGATTSELFSFARAVGDAVCFPSAGRAAVNDLRSARRQAAGRAFAAEFLAPIEEIKSMRRDGRDAITIANELAVEPEVVDRQLQNEARIVAVCG